MNITRRHWTAAVALAALGWQRCGDREDSAAETAGSHQGAARPVIDLHCDTPMLFRDGGYDLAARNERGEVDIPRLREGGVNAVFFSVYTSATRNTELEAVQEALEIIDAIRRETASHPEDLALATSSADIEAALGEGRIAVLIGVEGGHMINGSLAVLRALHLLGARYLTLTHSKSLAWAGSSGSDENAGLSEFGREVVAEMNGLGMMVDVSHVSDQTFWDALESSSAPVIASHSSARALASHKRNMSDEMIRATAERGGVVHVNYYNSFLDDDYARRSREWSAANPSDGEGQEERLQAMLAAVGRTPLSKLLDHFEHVARVGGIESVGMGSDFDGVNGELPEGMEDVSKVPGIAEGLALRGFSGADVDKVLGGNTMRVMRDVEAAARI